MPCRARWLLIVGALAIPSWCLAQVAQPAESVAERASEPPPAQPAASEAPEGERSPSYEALAVVRPPPGTLREEERIGEYAQPRWTGRRRFPTTRIYVIPAGQLGLEYWLEQKLHLDDPDQVRYRSLYELEMGLGHRLQLDVYLETQQEGHQGPWALHKEKLELRWALADWGVIPLNPTLYVELAREHGGPPVIELKALLGEQLAPRWHFGLNLVWEHQLGDAQQNETALTLAVAYGLVDEVFSLGAEIKAETVDVKGQRYDFDNWELLAGPSLAWAPTPPMHILLVALLGDERELDAATGDGVHTPIFQPTLVVGFEL